MKIYKLCSSHPTATMITKYLLKMIRLSNRSFRAPWERRETRDLTPTYGHSFRKTLWGQRCLSKMTKWTPMIRINHPREKILIKIMEWILNRHSSKWSYCWDQEISSTTYRRKMASVRSWKETLETQSLTITSQFTVWKPKSVLPLATKAQTHSFSWMKPIRSICFPEARIIDN